MKSGGLFAFAILVITASLSDAIGRQNTIDAKDKQQIVALPPNAKFVMRIVKFSVDCRNHGDS